MEYTMNIDNFVNDTLRELADMKNVEPPHFRWGSLTYATCDDCLTATFYPILLNMVAVIEATEVFKYLWRFYEDEVKIVLKTILSHEFYHYIQLLTRGMGYDTSSEKRVGLRNMTVEEASAIYSEHGALNVEIIYLEHQANTFAEYITGINSFEVFTRFARLVDKFIDENPNDLLSEHNKEVMSEYIYRAKERYRGHGWSEEMSWD